jgi:hypothetical protein
MFKIKDCILFDLQTSREAKKRFTPCLFFGYSFCSSLLFAFQLILSLCFFALSLFGEAEPLLRFFALSLFGEAEPLLRFGFGFGGADAYAFAFRRSRTASPRLCFSALPK